MKTLLLFDRCNLTDLFISLNKELSNVFSVIHVCYCGEDMEKLKKVGIANYIDYHQEISNAVDSLNVDDEFLNEIDSFIRVHSNGKFNLNSAIQYDRGFTMLSYQEAQRLAACHYYVWKKIFKEHHVDLLLHEPASLFMTYILSLLCKGQQGQYVYMTQASSGDPSYKYLFIDGETFRCPEIEKKYNYYRLHQDEIDIELCKKFIEKFRNDYSVLFSDLNNPRQSKASLLVHSLIKKIVIKARGKNFDKLKDNIDYWLLHSDNYAEKLYNLRQYSKRNVKFVRHLPENEKYYYYSLHLEPEATVLYLSGGLYANQIKLIENIASSLPPQCYLYVKDHPHAYAYRKADDYERLMKVPNIRLIHQNISGKRLIKNAIGVFSINGTAGFEGLMLGKQVYCFGECYYSPSSLVNYIYHIRDLQDVVYQNLNRHYETLNHELYTYTYAYLKSLHHGFVGYFGDSHKKLGIDLDKNAKEVAESIIHLFS